MSEALIVRRGGTGGMPLSNAIIHAKAPYGSTVTFSKGGVVVKTIGPDKAHANNDGVYADYYLSVSANNYGEWTVAATDGTHTTSETVTVSVAREYDVMLRYILYLFNNGDQCTAVTGGWKGLNGGNSKILDNSIVLIGASQAGHISAVTNNRVNPGGRTILKVKFVPANNQGSGDVYRLHAGLSNQNTSVGTSGMVVNYVENYTGHYNEERIYSIDISNYKNSDYFAMLDILLEKATIYQVWLEW